MNVALKRLHRVQDEDAIREDIRTVERLHRVQPSLDTLADRTHPSVAAELLDRAEPDGTHYVVDGDDHAEILGTLHDTYESVSDTGGTVDTLFQKGWDAYETDRSVADENLAAGMLGGHLAGVGSLIAGAQAGQAELGAAAMTGILGATYAGSVGYHHYSQGYRAAHTTDKAEAFIAETAEQHGDYRFAVDDPYDITDSPLPDPACTAQDSEENTAAFLETLCDWEDEGYIAEEELPEDYEDRLAEYRD